MTDEPGPLAVIGTGYVGLVTGACLAAAGNEVRCHDIDADRIRVLQDGGIPIHEPGLDDVVRSATASGRLRFTDELADALDGAAFAMLAVGTPQDEDGSADLTFIDQAFRDVLAACAEDVTVIVRSTVPPGTGDVLQDLADDLRPRVTVVNAPEFLAEGTAVRDFQEPDRLVFGGPAEATARVEALWRDVGRDAPRIHVDRITAELAKYASNTFLAARVSLINEMANLCDALGGDVRSLAKIVGLDARIGPSFLRAGIGYGGSCFPKDVQAVAAVARRAGVDVPVAEAAEVTNQAQWQRVAQRIEEAADGRPVAILGIAFKPGTDDVREAPGLKIARRLTEAGLVVRLYDPVAKAPDGCGTQVDDPVGACQGAAVVLHATEWPEHADLDWQAVADAMDGKLVLDGRNALDWGALGKAGLRVEGIGARARKEVMA